MQLIYLHILPQGTNFIPTDPSGGKAMLHEAT